MNLEQQIEHAKSILVNGKRMEELIEKRTQLTADLDTVNTELADLFGGVSVAEPAGTTRTCKICGQSGHISRNGACPKGNPPKEE